MDEITKNIIAGRTYPISLEVSHNSRGNTWTVKVQGDEPKKVFDELNELYKRLEKIYGKKE